MRDPAKADFAASVKTAVGDVLDRASLERALDGQEAVVCSLGTASFSGPFKEVTLFSEGTRNLVSAMQSRQVARLVCITGVGAGESKGHGPWLVDKVFLPLMLGGIYEDKTRQEEIVRESGLDWTLVRPAVLTDGAALGESAVKAFTDLNGVHVTKISRADVAAFCLRELADARYRGQAPAITYGPGKSSNS